jgi:Mlc titration factor MtfA (ptsG expression regulator)
MFTALRQRWQSRSEAQALKRRPIPDDLWKRTLIRFPFLQRSDPDTAAELRRLTRLFLDRKEFSTAGGLRLSDAMAVSIAAQAVLPVLRLGLSRYDRFVGIVVHPDAVRVRREILDESGIVHEYDEILAGEAMTGGPVTLSWRDVRSRPEASGPAYNVVIHEFAHVLDEGRGTPALPEGITPAEWTHTLTDAFERLSAQVAAGPEPDLEPHPEPPIDPYGAESPEEFFAVATECFFVRPQALHTTEPALYALLQRFYSQDPKSEGPDQAKASGRPRTR